MQDEARESGLPDSMIPADSITLYAQVGLTRRCGTSSLTKSKYLISAKMASFSKRIIVLNKNVIF
jgi:hypothetical protein